ncbi:MAG: MFS transporter [Acidimicrobiales bacterium]
MSANAPRWLLSALGTSILADAAAPVVLSFAAMSKGASSENIGFLLAASDAMMVVFLLVGGVAADRLGRRRVAIMASMLRLGSMVGFAIYLSLFSWSLAPALVFAGLWGVGAGFFFPTATGLVADTVSAGDLQRVNGWRGMVESVGQAVGPSIAGVVVGFFDPTMGALVCAAGVLLSLASLRRLPTGARQRRDSASDRSVLVEFREGWRELRAREWCWKIIGGFSVLHLLAFGPVVVVGPALAADGLGGAPGWGVVLGSMGLGSIIGAWRGMAVQWKFPLRGVVALSLLVSPLFFVLAWSHSLVLASASAFVGGAVFGVFGVVWETHLQREFAPEVLSRVSSYDWMGSLALYPVGQIGAGILAPIIGVRDVMLVAGVAIIVVSLAMLASKSIWFARRNDQGEAVHREIPSVSLAYKS